MIFDETIAAISTPIGAGGVSIVRISGKDALTIADLVFQAKQKPSELPSHTINYGLFVDPETKEIVDAVFLSIMREPKSYTGLDTVEINCHGGVLNTKKILEILINHGARLAEPGEFTKISFLNGKMDLSQVEAIADLINAKTQGARKSSISQLMGNLSSEIESLKNQLLHLCSLLELDLDFADENLLNIDSTSIIEKISDVEIQIRKLLSTYNTGHLIRDGARVAILGKPNVGKSSLLNAILMKNRAIVSELPGTTRDFIEESVDIGGIPFTFVDTAGIRETENQVEKIGINITKEQVENSDLIIFLMDASEPFDENDEEIVSFLNRLRKAGLVNNVLFACNKTDIKDPDENEVRRFINEDFISISATSNLGIEELKNHIKVLFENDVSFDSPMISRLRHKTALEKSLTNLADARAALGRKMSFEFVSFDVREAMKCLSEVTGDISTGDILDNIFSGFCIGK